MSSPTSPRSPRRFRPLNPSQPPHPHAIPLQGIIFDMDGTLCLPQTPMFAAMRTSARIPPGSDILTHISSLPPTEAAAAMEKIKAVEREYMVQQVPQPGLRRLMAYLHQRGVRKAVLTRNFEEPVAYFVERFLHKEGEEEIGEVWPLVTRSFEPPKPRPDGIWYIARQWGLSSSSPPVDSDLDRAEHGSSKSTEEKIEEVGEVMDEEASEEEKLALGRGLIMVGDSLDDMVAGRKAGAATVLLASEVNGHLRGDENTDLVVERLDELVEVLERGFVGREI